MLKLPAIFLFVIYSVSSLAQGTVKGVVVDATTKQPLAGSSIFINNSSLGTVSDKNGSFEIMNIPTGKHDLIISSIGYETNVYSFRSDQLPLKLRVEMDLKVTELENVTVEPSLEEGWDKWGQMFTDYFLGVTPNAQRCRIINKDAIRFRFYKKSNRVIAYSDEPVIIENKALGYRIKYQMESFEVKFKEGSMMFTGYPFFEDMSRERRTKNRWVKARNEAYYGSMMHFMRAVYENKVAEEGFDMRRMYREPNYEQQRIKSFYKPKGLSRIVVGAKPVVVTANQDSLHADSISYYEKVLRQKDYKEIYGRHLLSADSICQRTEEGYAVLFFHDYVFITYKNETEDLAYLRFHHESRSPTFQQSYIWLPNQTAIAIDANGVYFPPQEIYSRAYWGWEERMANMLPLDFRPVK